jgi:hypothetical protein
MDGTMNARTVIVSFALAGAAGAVLGVLFAPAKGADARKRIARLGAHFARESVHGPTMRVDVACSGFDTFKDSALDWADMGEMTVFSRNMTDRAW